MNRRASLLASLPALAGLLAAAGAAEVGPNDAPEAAMMADLEKQNLDTLSNAEEKKRFLNTIMIEKMKLQKTLLKGVYESAFDLYREGDFQSAEEVSSRILAIDPTFEDAAMLRDASIQLKGTPNAWQSQQRLVDDYFKDGLDLYQQNRLIEALRRFEEVVKLSPIHIKARYWVRRCKNELSEVHYNKGVEAYQGGHLDETLDHWYAALLLNPGYPRLVASIQRVEAEKRQREANRLMQQALTYYGQGKLEDTLKILRQIQELNPGDSKAKGLLAEIRSGVAEKHVADGRKLYAVRKFPEAIREWETAEKGGYDKEKVRALIARARDMIKREKEAAQRRADELARKEKEQEEAAKKKEEAAAKKKEEGGAGGGFELDTGPTAPQEGGPAAGAAGGTGTAPTSAEGSKTVEGKQVVSAAAAQQLSPEQQEKVNEAKRREALQHYQSGMVFMQNRQIEQAKHELEEAKKLDPSNLEVDAALRRIDAMIQGQ